jgi:hypothetical protein
LSSGVRGKDYGYRLARELRTSVGVSSGSPIDDLNSVLRRKDGLSMSVTDHKPTPSTEVSAIVGWNDSARACMVAPLPSRDDSRRFLEARGLFHALTGCAAGPRLVTKAFTWEQQAGRAFAAELLAPQEALAEVARADMDMDERRDLQSDLAKKYNVSSELIRLQLENHGIWGDEAA